MNNGGFHRFLGIRNMDACHFDIVIVFCIFLKRSFGTASTEITKENRLMSLQGRLIPRLEHQALSEEQYTPEASG